MKQHIVYYGTLDLKSLRKKYGLTVEELADLIYCSSRTINRIEACNQTSNIEIARKYADKFGYSLENLFVAVDQHFLERLASVTPFVPLGAPLAETVYYLLYFRRISWWDANMWGKTKWVGIYDDEHELRALHELEECAAQKLGNQGIPAINTQAEWNSFFYRSVIGRTQRILVSEACLKRCAPRTLAYYAVEPQILFATGQPDVILLGDYTNVPEVFSVPSKRI